MVLVFGSNGNLGSVVLNRFRMKGISVLGFNHSQVDVTSELCVWRIIDTYKPELVINCVAATNVDWCETNRDLAYRVNSDAVKYIAMACRKNNSKFIQISTDYVFDGQSEDPYTEESITMPLNIYGDTKLSGEKNALEYGGIVARVQWLLGYQRPNYLTWIIEQLNQGKRVELSTQMGSPTEVGYISDCLELLHRSQSTHSGVFNLSNSDYCSRYDIGQYICELFKIDPKMIEAVDNVNFGSALRPKNTKLSNEKFVRHFNVVGMVDWKSNVLNFLRCKYGYSGK